MSRWRKAAVVAAVLAAFGLSGCTAGLAREVKLPDGRTVVCVGSESKPDCDWSNAK
ncbi:hypothetical protein SEA_WIGGLEWIGGLE_89 [Mycobacterium phage Wigglewiggle]|nr:hypothetical protein SEA_WIGGLEWIGGLE_89 [Mycobacterium phage Wigglewiggle]